MTYFGSRDGVLCAEGVPLPVIAEAVGTPVHVYSAAALRDAAHRFRSALAILPKVRVAFAVKANPNGAVLHLLAGCGFGADIVSGGEMRRALDAGIAASDIVFSGVGKNDRELADALTAGVGQFNLELEEEGQVLAALARARGRRATAVLRVNPDVDGGTHAKISTGRRGNKFGVAIADVPRCTTDCRSSRVSTWSGSRCTSVVSCAISRRSRKPMTGSAGSWRTCARAAMSSAASISAAASAYPTAPTTWFRRSTPMPRWSRRSRATGMSS